MSNFGTSAGNGLTNRGAYTTYPTHQHGAGTSTSRSESAQTTEQLNIPSPSGVKVCSSFIHERKAPNPLQNRLYHRDLIEFYDTLRGLVGGLGKHSDNHNNVSALLRIPLFREAARTRVISIEGAKKYSVSDVLPRLTQYRKDIGVHADLIDSSFGGGKPDFKYLKAVDMLLSILEKEANKYKSVPVKSAEAESPKIAVSSSPSDYFSLLGIEVNCPSVLTRLATFGIVQGTVPYFRTYGHGAFKDCSSLSEVARTVLKKCAHRGMATSKWGDHKFEPNKEALTPK
jgi:hypothetical protein